MRRIIPGCCSWVMASYLGAWNIGKLWRYCEVWVMMHSKLLWDGSLVKRWLAKFMGSAAVFPSLLLTLAVKQVSWCWQLMAYDYLGWVDPTLLSGLGEGGGSRKLDGDGGHHCTQWWWSRSWVGCLGRCWAFWVSVGKKDLSGLYWWWRWLACATSMCWWWRWLASPTSTS